MSAFANYQEIYKAIRIAASDNFLLKNHTVHQLNQRL
ncbi:Uncharacterised protein [Candidatus Venteria ishoeyi]|uniref:Uncharacterized protein n=1 Tax=Candidatus Venteria ishoeyi TaxID=1899563 RepID=A0A1H6FHE1_9GAMM|nr:Uncharacterised protein [Candidatus Venteria ishoeyi]